MQNKPLVSIITPCYNSEAYLSRYLENILQQTYSNIELIIVNDGSKDLTETICLNYVNRYKERGYSFKYIFQENKGLGGAINTALKYIQGDYFAWCDSDNFYTNDYVETKVEFFLRNPQYSIVRCDGNIVNDSDLNSVVSKMSQGNTDKFQENLFENCLFEKNFHFGCAMLKTEDFDKINPNREIYPSRHGQNWQLLLPMFYHYKSGYIDKAMFYFVYRADSVSNCVQQQELKKQYQQKEEYCNIIVKTLEFMQIPEKNKYIKEIEIKYAKIKLRIAVNAKDKKQSNVEYNKLKKWDAVDYKTKILYWSGKNSLLKFTLRLLRRVQRLISKK